MNTRNTTDWNKVKLKEVLKIGNGRDHKNLESGNIPVFGTGGLMRYVNMYLHDGKTVFIGRKGTIDKPYYYEGKFWTVDTLFYTHSFQNTTAEFIYLIFQMINWKKHNEASGVPSLSKKNISNIKILLPSLQEQNSIVAVLETWDKAIDALSKKIKIKKNIKKGLMQQLLTGKKRLSGFKTQWDIVKLSDICDVVSSKRVLQKDWKDKGVPFYRTREVINLSKGDSFGSPIFISEELFSKLKKKYGVPKAGDILVTGVGSIGITYIVKNTDKFYFKDGNVLWVKVSKKMISSFLYHQFKSRFVRKQLSDNASITTVATFTIDGARNTKILYPELKEQKAIAEILTTADYEIIALEKKKQLFQDQKKFLLNNLVTGKIRTPEDLLKT